MLFNDICINQEINYDDYEFILNRFIEGIRSLIRINRFFRFAKSNALNEIKLELKMEERNNYIFDKVKSLLKLHSNIILICGEAYMHSINVPTIKS